MKLCFVAIHDYGMGQVGIKVFARSKEEVKSVLPEPKWQIYGPDETRHLLYLESLPESDFDDKSQLLQNYIDISLQGSMGKTFFTVRDPTGEVRNIWARSATEILVAYPALFILFIESSESTGYSDVDKPDDFLKRNARNNAKSTPP